MNHTPVTLSDLRIDLWRGQIILQDLIIHNKDREIWEWESPCLARVGRIECTLNFCSVVDIPYYGSIFNHTFKDIYTGCVEDVQVFVEKRRNVFNFHLLDDCLDIPDGVVVMEEYRRRNKGMMSMTGSNSAAMMPNENNGEQTTTSAAEQDRGMGDESDSFLTLSQSMSLNNNNTNTADDDRLDASISTREAGSQSREKQLDEAAVIVEKLVGAVSNLGRAATDGGSKALHSAIKNQKENLVKSMKMLHSSTVSSALAADSNEPAAAKAKKDKVAESVSVIRQLGKVVEQNVTDIKDQMSFLQKPPKRKEGLPKKKVDIVRIGSLLLREMRIFTKDVLVQKSTTVSNEVPPSSDGPADSPNRDGPIQPSNNQAGWSRPIVIWELAFAGAEFSPHVSARDANTGLPVVGIPVDRAVDIILKRLMTEAAKSNTGRLLETAFGDVFSFMNVKSTPKL